MIEQLGDFALPGGIGLYLGDARELSRGIPDNSVDMVFTDPPYPREFLPLYYWVAREAARVLKPGGYLFAYGAADSFFDIFERLESSPLSYFWVDALLHNGAYPRMWHKKLLSGYKPVFIYTKGAPARKVWRATVAYSKQSKQYHHWGQGADYVIKILEMLTEPGEIIFEPFAGGGTTLAVCKSIGRACLGFELDESSFEVAKERIKNTGLPLIKMGFSQLELFAESLAEAELKELEQIDILNQEELNE